MSTGFGRRIRHGINTGIGRIIMSGYLPESRGLPEAPLRVLGSYAVVYLLAGHGRFADEFGRVTDTRPGDLLVIFPDIGHTYGPSPGEPWSQIFVTFEGPLFDLWRHHKLLDPTRPLRHLEPIDQWARTFQDIVGVRSPTTVASALKNLTRLQLVLAETVALPQHEETRSEDERWLAQAMALLDGDIRRDLPLERIASELAMSYDGFRKRFRRLTGVAPAQYRSRQAIDRACDLMAEGHLTDREIAATLGFCDEFHFSHRFRQLTGRSPRQFRATIPVRGRR